MQADKYNLLKLENQLCFPLYAASREIIKQYRPYLDKLGLTYTQYITMMVLWQENRISVKELGRRLFLDSGTLTPVLKSLEQKGYISRYRSKEDERVLLAEITAQGKQLRDKAASIPERISSCVNLSGEEAESLYSLLYKILDSFKTHKGEHQ